MGLNSLTNTNIFTSPNRKHMLNHYLTADCENVQIMAFTNANVVSPLVFDRVKIFDEFSNVKLASQIWGAFLFTTYFIYSFNSFSCECILFVQSISTAKMNKMNLIQDVDSIFLMISSQIINMTCKFYSNSEKSSSACLWFN